MSNVAEKKPVPVALIVGLILAVIVAFAVGSQFMPHNEPKVVENTSPQAKQMKDWFKQKAQETQGDFSKLSSADQQQATQYAGGFAAKALADAWKSQQSK